MVSQDSTEPTEIYLVTRTEAAGVPDSRRPAEVGGEEQGLFRDVTAWVGEHLGLTPRPTADFKQQLDRTMREVAVILQAASNATFAKLSFESMEVGIAITGKGSIGIVTAGVEASLKLRFKPASSPGSSPPDQQV